MGRGVRRIIIRGFLIQDSQMYGGGDVITQRQALITACEEKGTGTLIHPTLGEMTVAIPENGLRLSGSADAGRVFEFTLMAIESGLKVCGYRQQCGRKTVRTNYLKLVSTTVFSTIARIKGEIRGVTQAIKTIKSTIAFWTNMVDSTTNEVTNVSNVLKSTFGNQRYGRYSKGRWAAAHQGLTVASLPMTPMILNHFPRRYLPAPSWTVRGF
jgi:prophage DNA circulation protein